MLISRSDGEELMPGVREEREREKEEGGRVGQKEYEIKYVQPSSVML